MYAVGLGKQRRLFTSFELLFTYFCVSYFFKEKNAPDCKNSPSEYLRTLLGVVNFNVINYPGVAVLFLLNPSTTFGGSPPFIESSHHPDGWSPLL